ncbi:MAG: 6-phosphofructokinase [Spirochaetales bacterium]|nr:6-phosphofructokinase [Spirochaetales bacterium]
MAVKSRCIGILTSGGDCPGLNAAIRAVGKTLVSRNIGIIGILDGFTGLVQNKVIPLGPNELSGLLTIGGTILGTSRNKPHKMPLPDGKYHDMTGAAIENYHRLGLDCLVCIGGGGTQKNSYRLMKAGNLNIVTLPKTIDNDIWGTDVSFGFDTAVTIASEAVDRLHTTASSHHRTMICDVMGHNTGWLALSAGIAGGADVILIPEIAYHPEKVMEALVARRKSGKRFSIIVNAEGANPIHPPSPDGHGQAEDEPVNFFPHRLPSSEALATGIEKTINIETRVTTLGYLQRGGIPTPADRILATRLGTGAAASILDGIYGVMMAVRGSEIIPIPLEEIAGKKKTVPPDHHLIQTARRLGVSFGD